MFINRNWSITEEDDFSRIVSSGITEKNEELLPVYGEDNQVLGWKKQARYS